MVNNYEAPEIVEIGETKDLILGIPKIWGRFDSLTQAYNRDPTPVLDDADN